MPTLHKLMAPLLGVALLLAATPVSSTVSGNHLLEFCKGTGKGETGYNVVSNNICVAYLAGVNDAELTLVAVWGKAKTFCIPEGTSTEQLRQVFLRHMGQYPEDWHLPGAVLVINAFVEAWPCAD